MQIGHLNRRAYQQLKKIDDEFVVMSDPGHGSIDPGAVNDSVNEKDLMLTLGR